MAREFDKGDQLSGGETTWTNAGATRSGSRRVTWRWHPEVKLDVQMNESDMMQAHYCNPSLVGVSRGYEVLHLFLILYSIINLHFLVLIYAIQFQRTGINQADRIFFNYQ